LRPAIRTAQTALAQVGTATDGRGEVKDISSERWAELINTSTEHLTGLAAQRGSVDYSTYNVQVCGGLFDLGEASDRNQLSLLLGDVSRASVRQHDVMLSALVHRKGKRMEVGGGFYVAAIQMGRLKPNANKDDRLVFLGKEIEAVYARFKER
jgi:hypothetical protein